MRSAKASWTPPTPCASGGWRRKGSIHSSGPGTRELLPRPCVRLPATEEMKLGKWPRVKIQIGPPVHVPIPTQIGSKMGGSPTPKWYHCFKGRPKENYLVGDCPKKRHTHIRVSGALSAVGLVAPSLNKTRNGSLVCGCLGFLGTPKMAQRFSFLVSLQKHKKGGCTNSQKRQGPPPFVGFVFRRPDFCGSLQCPYNGGGGCLQPPPVLVGRSTQPGWLEPEKANCGQLQLGDSPSHTGFCGEKKEKNTSNLIQLSAPRAPPPAPQTSMLLRNAVMSEARMGVVFPQSLLARATSNFEGGSASVVTMDLGGWAFLLLRRTR